MHGGRVIKTLARSLILVLIVAMTSQVVLAFPEEEITGITDGPPFSFSFTDTATSFLLKDNRTMLVTYGQVLRLVDMGFYELYAEQPFDLSTDDNEDNDSPFNGAVYLKTTDEAMITQERGHLIIYKLGSLADEPTDITIAEGDSLGPIAVNNSETEAYIGDNTADSVIVVDLATLTVTSKIVVTLQPPQQQSFDFTKAVFVPTTNSVYFSTDKGGVVAVQSGSTVATVINVGLADSDRLTGIAKTPGDAYLYTANSSKIESNKINTSSTSTITDIDVTPNTAPNDVIVTDVKNPNSTYAYVAGGNGVSVIDPSNVVLTLGSKAQNHEPITTSAAPKKLVASTDGYVYMSLATNEVGIISENPWITIVDVVYSGGGSSLGAGETVTITFRSNKDGTYELRSGGGVDASGTLLVDDGGNASGSVTADTDTSVTIPYDTNKNAFDEGDNEVFVFVTDANSNLGRRGTIVNVDTPPDVVTLQSTGFGNGRVYVTFNLLTASDMDHYNIYVDTDPDAVLTKVEVAAVYSQPDSGTTITAEVTGLTNGVTYYLAVEGVDQGGNVSPSRGYLLPSGERASAIPQRTVGPAGFSGESGCALSASNNSKGSYVGTLILLFTVLTIIFVSKIIAESAGRGASDTWFGGRDRPMKKWPGSKTRSFICLILMVVVLLIAQAANAQWVERRPSPQWWSFEAKTGFWLPQSSNIKRFFGPCCNIITRLQGGLLIHGKYGIEQGVGFMIKGGDAIGINNGEPSSDRFSFLTIPMETNFAYRMDYWDGKYVVPYIKVGVDYVFYRENTKGDVTKGLKWGAHGVAGLQLPLAQFFDEVATADAEYGLNDMCFTFEAQYQWINDFGGSGLDLSGWLFSIGVLFLF